MTKTFKKRLLSIVLTLVTCLSIIPSIPVKAATNYDSYISGVSTTAQSVYYGPSSGYYTAIGSIGSGEKIYILGKEKGLGWYHILYHAGSKNMKSGYIPTSTVRNISNGTPHEEEYYGGYAYSNSYQKVWSCDDPSTAVEVGSIDAGEGVTRLYAYNNVMFIEYTTNNKAKRGYVFSPNFSYPVSPTCVGRITTSSSLSYGANPNLNFQNVGSVGAREFVAVLGASATRGYAYVEYNTNSGRKRGYIPTGCISLSGGETWTSLPDLYGCVRGQFISFTNVYTAYTTQVYATPTKQGIKMHSLPANYPIIYAGQVTINGVAWNNIVYKPSGSNSYVSGYMAVN